MEAVVHLRSRGQEVKVVVEVLRRRALEGVAALEYSIARVEVAEAVVEHRWMVMAAAAAAAPPMGLER